MPKIKLHLDLPPGAVALDLRKLGRAIRVRRRVRGIILTDLARDIGISQSFMSHIEQGQAHSVGISVIDAIAAHLGTTVEDLVISTKNHTYMFHS